MVGSASVSISLVTGSYPPDACGVGDYAGRLASALEREAVKVKVITGSRWGLGALGSLRRQLASAGSSLIHLQYPTVGYGSGLAPQGLALATEAPVVVTLHEFTVAHVLRRLACFPFALGARHIIFPTEVERTNFCATTRFSLSRSSVIPIGSTIPTGARTASRNGRVCFFGLLVKKASLNTFLELVRLSQRRQVPLQFDIIGAVPAAERDQRYIETLQRETAGFPVRWLVGAPAHLVAAALAEASYAYLPFSDGASLRRSSLMAALSNGVAVITTDAPSRPPGLEHAVRFARNPEDALAILQGLRVSCNATQELSCRARSYAREFSWEYIARRHRELYLKIINTAVRDYDGGQSAS